jgi:hypothetical protein
MRQRLQVLGFTAERAVRELDSAIRELNEMPEPLAREYEPKVPEREAVMRQLEAILGAGSDPFDYPDEPMIFVQLDPRVVLRLALDLIRDDSVLVRLNLDDLGRWGFITRGAPLADDARRALADEVSRDASLVVLTEGSSDSQLLSDALQVTHPHMVGFMRFMDFGFGAQGGVGSLMRIVRLSPELGSRTGWSPSRTTTRSAAMLCASFRRSNCRTTTASCTIRNFPCLSSTRRLGRNRTSLWS